MNPFQERIDLIHVELAGTSRTIERSAQLREQLAQLEGAIALACPRCKEHEGLADVTMYPGVCDGTFARLTDGTVDFEGDGETDICWDMGEPPKDLHTVQCSCGWTGRKDDLVVFVPEPEDELECEDCNVNGDGCRTHGEAFKAARQAIAADPDRTLAALRGAGLLEEEA